MKNSYIKSLFSEPWDNYQLKFLFPGFGGNKSYYDFLSVYNMELESDITFKYTSKVAQYYKIKLRALIDEKDV